MSKPRSTWVAAVLRCKSGTDKIALVAGFSLTWAFSGTDLIIVLGVEVDLGSPWLSGQLCDAQLSAVERGSFLAMSYETACVILDLLQAEVSEALRIHGDVVGMNRSGNTEWTKKMAGEALHNYTTTIRCLAA